MSTITGVMVGIVIDLSMVEARRIAVNIAKLPNLLVGGAPMTDFDGPKDLSWLRAFDWLELNKLQRVYKDGGDDALEGACGLDE